MNKVLASAFVIITVFHINLGFDTLEGPLHLKDSVQKCLCESKLNGGIIYTKYDCKGIPKSDNMTKFLQCYLWDTHDFIQGKCQIDTVVLPTYLPADLYQKCLDCEKKVKSKDSTDCYYEFMDCFYNIVIDNCQDHSFFSIFKNWFG